MASFDKRDVLIHFDELSGEIVFYTVDCDDTAEIRKQEFDGARSNIASILQKSPDEAERDLGAVIFSLIDTFSSKKIGIRDYKSLNDYAHKEYVSDLEIESVDGSAEAKYYLFIEYYSRALFECDMSSLIRAELLLNESAAQGFRDAIERLDGDWALMKKTVITKIENQKLS
jgi:hypothetical protein